MMREGVGWCTEDDRISFADEHHAKEIDGVQAEHPEYVRVEESQDDLEITSSHGGPGTRFCFGDFKIGEKGLPPWDLRFMELREDLLFTRRLPIVVDTDSFGSALDEDTSLPRESRSIEVCLRVE